MTSKQKRKMLTKSLSHDVTSVSPGHHSNSSNSVAGSTSNLSEETAGRDVRLVRREEFICSDNHHAHLEEDYLEDESRLFGRQLTLPTPPSGNFHVKSSSSSSSGRTLRKLFKSKSVDTHSIKSSANVDASVVRKEVDRRFEAAFLNNAEQDHKMPAEDEEEVDSLFKSNSLPRKPPRKRGPSLSIKRDSIDARNGSVDVRTVENEVTNNEQERRGDLGRSGLLRSNSVIRPLECDPRPKLYSRQSITHARQFSQESAEAVDGDHISLAVDANNRSNGSIMAMSPERPQRRRYSQLVKRESLIHPTRPPRRRPPLGTSSLYQPLIVNGRFQNPWSTWRKPSFVGSLRWTFATKDNSSVPKSVEELDKMLPVLPLRLDDIRHSPLDGIRVTWLGHATVLVQFGDISVLTDPMFSDRASPLGFFGPKRIRRFPGSVYDLPKLDAVVISHNHYDHLDYNSVLLLNARFGADLHWFVPVGLRTWMHNAGCETVTELTWWAEGSLSHPSDVSFCFTPAQHWSKRTPTDDNKVLWGSWCILAPRYRFFFAGDTGYCDAFKQIGDQFGPFDMAAIPIGAYEPRWFMHNQHIDPTEAVKIHQDIKANKSLGIHWGTFILTNEHYLEPPLKLADAVRHAGLPNDDFFVLKHGESRLIHGS